MNTTEEEPDFKNRVTGHTQLYLATYAYCQDIVGYDVDTLEDSQVLPMLAKAHIGAALLFALPITSYGILENHLQNNRRPEAQKWIEHERKLLMPMSRINLRSAMDDWNLFQYSMLITHNPEEYPIDAYVRLMVEPMFADLGSSLKEGSQYYGQEDLTYSHLALMQEYVAKLPSLFNFDEKMVKSQIQKMRKKYQLPLRRSFEGLLKIRQNADAMGARLRANIFDNSGSEGSTLAQQLLESYFGSHESELDAYLLQLFGMCATKEVFVESFRTASVGGARFELLLDAMREYNDQIASSDRIVSVYDIPFSKTEQGPIDLANSVRKMSATLFEYIAQIPHSKNPFEYQRSDEMVSDQMSTWPSLMTIHNVKSAKSVLFRSDFHDNETGEDVHCSISVNKSTGEIEWDLLEGPTDRDALELLHILLNFAIEASTKITSSAIPSQQPDPNRAHPKRHKVFDQPNPVYALKKQLRKAHPEPQAEQSKQQGIKDLSATQNYPQILEDSATTILENLRLPPKEKDLILAGIQRFNSRQELFSPKFKKMVDQVGASRYRLRIGQYRVIVSEEKGDYTIESIRSRETGYSDF